MTVQAHCTRWGCLVRPDALLLAAVPVRVLEYVQPRRMGRISVKTLPDYLAPDLDIVFVGINPGAYSAEVGHYFRDARPTAFGRPSTGRGSSRSR